MLLLSYSLFSYSADNGQLLNQKSIQLEQKQRLVIAEQQRFNLKNRPIINSDDEIQASNDESLCFVIKLIDLKGMTVFSNRQKNKLITHYYNKCLTVDDMHNISKLIYDYYISEGYITTQVNFPEQELTQGILTILIIEGVIESIDIQNSPTRTVNMIYPSLIGKILNLRDIEQGLEQLNRLSSFHYSIDIQAGSKTGLSHILIHREGKHFPLNAQFELNNSGAKSTGEKQLSLDLTADSLLNLAEQWSLSANSDTEVSKSNYNRNYTFGLNLPYGYWTYLYHLFNSHSFQINKINYQSFDYKVKNLIQWLEVSRLIYRDAKQRVLLQGGLENKQTETQFAGKIIEISSPILTALNFSAQYSRAIRRAYLTFNPAFKQGIAAFGSSPEISIENYPRSHFRKFSLNASYQYITTSNSSFLTSFYGQLTSDNLYGIEQIHIGGHYSVRGFKAQTLSGNQGFYWRNEINYHLVEREAITFSLIGAWDIGYLAESNSLKQNSLSGSAIGINLSHSSGIRTQFFVSSPLYYPANLEPERWSLY